MEESDMSLPTYKYVQSEEKTGITTAEVFADAPCRMVKFLAHPNTGRSAIGGASVTIPNRSDNVTGGYPLDPGDQTDWIPTDNASHFYAICAQAADSVIMFGVQ
jgi:hypothetical protein